MGSHFLISQLRGQCEIETSSLIIHSDVPRICTLKIPTDSGMVSQRQLVTIKGALGKQRPKTCINQAQCGAGNRWKRFEARACAGCGLQLRQCSNLVLLWPGQCGQGGQGEDEPLYSDGTSYKYSTSRYIKHAFFPAQITRVSCK